MELLSEFKLKLILSDEVIWRYEPNIKQGTMFLYNIATGKIFSGELFILFNSYFY